MWRHLAAVFAVALCLVAHASGGSVVKRAVPSPHYIQTGPNNTATLLNTVTAVTLTCRVPADTAADARVQWWEYGTLPTGNLISDGNIILPGHPSNLRYSLELGIPGQYDLVIYPVDLVDGTYFKCVDVNSAPPDQTELGAQVVVIEDYPNCTTTMTSSIVLEGEYHTMECTMYFRASLGVEPLMTWTGPEPFLKAYTATNVSVWSGISFTVSRNMDASSYSCLTNFTSKGFSSPNSADNIPTWSSTYRSPQILVHWGPKNMYISPQEDRYEVGTVITCFADAFPAATIYWQSLDTSTIWRTPSLVITESLVGTNRMRCHAENYINNILYYNDFFTNIIVNPVPTTPEPGPETTTTLPPDEAYCKDLTGRWQSDSPRASLCLWVDQPSNGVVAGLLRNDTDTYWLDIYGRVQVNTYDQGGFSTVSPGTIGVTAYVLECKACLGVETMTVSQLQRSDTSSQQCGDPGVSNVLPDFKFYRVASTPPCNSPPPSF